MWAEMIENRIGYRILEGLSTHAECGRFFGREVTMLAGTYDVHDAAHAGFRTRITPGKPKKDRGFTRGLVLLKL